MSTVAQTLQVKWQKGCILARQNQPAATFGLSRGSGLEMEGKNLFKCSNCGELLVMV